MKHTLKTSKYYKLNKKFTPEQLDLLKFFNPEGYKQAIEELEAEKALINEHRENINNVKQKNKKYFYDPEYHRRYNAERKAEKQAYQKAYYQKNKEKIKKQNLEWYRNNPERVKELKRLNYLKTKYNDHNNNNNND